ncbi:hypothetical protein GW17_00015567 [Ensete ventricosum]|nr:hypothetical protein GW17_00015567 [Ensete ventricosum]
MQVRVNTRLLYQQTKFNLLREESEGYAKLVKMAVVQCHVSKIKSNMAWKHNSFEFFWSFLFPKVLECFEVHPDNHTFYGLIPIFPKHKCAENWQNNVYSHLLPKDDEAFEHYDAFVARRFDEVCLVLSHICCHTSEQGLQFRPVSPGTGGTYRSTRLLVCGLSATRRYHAQILLDRLSHLNPVEHVEICDGLFRYA